MKSQEYKVGWTGSSSLLQCNGAKRMTGPGLLVRFTGAVVLALPLSQDGD